MLASAGVGYAMDAGALSRGAQCHRANNKGSRVAQFDDDELSQVTAE